MEVAASYLLIRDPRAQRIVDEFALERQPDTVVEGQDLADAAQAILATRGLAPRGVRARLTSEPDAVLPHETALKAAFALSLAADAVHWRTAASIRDSRIRLVQTSGYAIHGTGREAMRESLTRLSLERQGAANYEAPVTIPEARRLLSDGSLRLERASPGERSSAADAFRSGVTTWSMPYRGREGRSAWFVAYIEDALDSVPLGILEVGDDAPLNPARDRALGFDVDATLGAYAVVDSAELRDRFAALRGALHVAPVASTREIFGDEAGRLVDRLGEVIGRPTLGEDAEAAAAEARVLLDRTRGYSRSSDDESDQERQLRKGEVPPFMAVGKWITYATRLVMGEIAASRRLGDSGLREGMRALRDVTIPRVTLEATVCGALPPFGPLLGGKLVASLMAHPSVTAVANSGFGTIVRSAFDSQRLAQLLPSNGALAMTTKGLYQAHSAQYTGVLFPEGSADWRPRLRHVGDTVGDTSSHVSETTMDLADSLMRIWAFGEHGAVAISRLYGSGGGKRQRILEHVTRRVGLPVELAHAGVRRPIYVLALVQNLHRAALLGEAPIGRWVERSNSTHDTYEDATLQEWRRRWLPVAIRRTT